jgi:hypothetical protein
MRQLRCAIANHHVSNNAILMIDTLEIQRSLHSATCTFAITRTGGRHAGDECGDGLAS